MDGLESIGIADLIEMMWALRTRIDDLEQQVNKLSEAVTHLAETQENVVNRLAVQQAEKWVQEMGLR